ncbi:hypothetical protein ATANTOWER_004027 [Ataeniobius toweri]|uniref:Uncharacterized protein n=1 Tax=Ataeniobius toweri TaxID=208326 RepID=A0ABU7BXD5_9TELE|nr:hypothetical protein [Ataeniobius toweri]
MQSRSRRRKFKPSLPSILMGNVRSLGNYLGELQALQSTQTELSNHTSGQRFKEEQKMQRRWTGSTCEQQMVSSRTCYC